MTVTGRQTQPLGAAAGLTDDDLIAMYRFVALAQESRPLRQQGLARSGNRLGI